MSEQKIPELWWSPTECMVYADREGAARRYLQMRDTRHFPLPADALPLVAAPPAPRVFFPGETLPAGVWFVAEGKHGGVTTPTLSNGDRTVRVSPKLEVFVPTGEEFKAAVDRARAERGET